MPSKRKEPPKPTGTIQQRSVEDVLHNSMIPYAEYVILERALPRVEDGLKPVQRRIIYTMFELGITPDKPHRKSARIVGDTLGKYHPHGDTAVYDAMVRMAQDFNMRYLLVDGHGNFGSVDGDSAAAMRYTEARLTELAMELIRDLDKDTVPFSLNFDDTMREPDLFPGRFPNLLVNGASGIAVGLATNIPPHNLSEVIDGVIAQIDDPDITLEGLMEHVKGPDFPTGGTLIGTAEIKKAYETGRGRMVVRAACHIEESTAGRRNIVITELPYQVNKAALLEKILKLSEERKGVLTGIHDIRDESDRTGMRAVIEVKKDADAEVILNYLYKYSDLQVTFGANMVAIAGGKPVLMGLKAINAHYIQHQKNVVTRRTRHELAQAKARAHILEGLVIAVENIDEVIRIIRRAESVKEARENLMARFELTQVQAQAILDMRLARLTALEILSLKKELAELEKLIRKLEGILGSERKLLALIKSELLEIKARFGDERRTRIEADAAKAEINPEAFKVVEDVLVCVSRGGFIKSVNQKNMARQANLVRQTNLVRQAPEQDGDVPPEEVHRFVIETNTASRLLLLTSQGNAYLWNVENLPGGKWKEKGVHLSGVIPGFAKDERVLYAEPAQFEAGGELNFYTESGQVKRGLLADYNLKKTKFAALKLKEGDGVVNIERVQPELNILLITEKGMSICFPQADIPVTGRVAAGVKGIKLAPGDRVAFAQQVSDEGEAVLMSDGGYGKRSLLVDYEPQGRNGKGLKTFDFKKNGSNGTRIAAAFIVKEPQDLVFVQKSGERTVLSSEEILIENRFSRGRPMVMVLLGNDVVDAYPAPAAQPEN